MCVCVCVCVCVDPQCVVVRRYKNRKAYVSLLAPSFCFPVAFKDNPRFHQLHCLKAFQLCVCVFACVCANVCVECVCFGLHFRSTYFNLHFVIYFSYTDFYFVFILSLAHYTINDCVFEVSCCKTFTLGDVKYLSD